MASKKASIDWKVQQKGETTINKNRQGVIDIYVKVSIENLLFALL